MNSLELYLLRVIAGAVLGGNPTRDNLPEPPEAK
jgi:hypothetical protein